MPFNRMKRREFITLLGGAAAAWPLTASAQQAERVRRIGVFAYYSADDPESSARLGAFRRGLQALGWTENRNLAIEVHRYFGDPDHIRAAAAELVGLMPEVILTYGPAGVAALRRETNSIPIVFTQVTNPLGAGFVASMARPGGNITGFTSFELSIAGKWLQVLKEIVPSVTRFAVILNPDNPGQGGFQGTIEMASSSLGVQIVPIVLRDGSEPERVAMERAVEAFARQANCGMIVLPDFATITLRQPIVALAARLRLPAVYPLRFFATAGGLVSYGIDQIEQSRLAAGYVDRILKGEKPADLPVQAPTKFELVLNLKTAKALGLDVPPTLLARADEVIE
jgi:putative tryptophan/tyrosine transport system substrate-binding protein